MDWQLLWFVLLGVLLTGYAILDGFDFGVGILHPWVAKTDEERRIVLNAIGPLWDGNEVWLVTFGGALFAAFPIAYASVFSSFYLPFMLMLVALIFRATAIEFRSKQAGRLWRRTWDLLFSGASGLAALLMGTAVGGALRGIPIGEHGIYQGTQADLLHPYALGVGALAVAMLAMHGAIYLYLKTEGALQARLVQWMWRTFGLFLVLYLFVTIATLVSVPAAIAPFQQAPGLWAIVVLNVLVIANIPRAIYHQRPGYAFLSSSTTIAALVLLFGAALFPNLVMSTVDPSLNLTIRNASSSISTLKIMSLIAVIGMPLVLTYTGIVYWTFRWKVKLGEFSY